jgi:hypothetical protein
VTLVPLLDLVAAESSVAAVEPAGEAVQPAQVAVSVVARMVRVLPVGDRSRYRQEYLAELLAMAEEHASGRAQLTHALRAAMLVRSLRRALRAPRPGRQPAR